MATLDRRDLQPELMDDAELPADSHHQALVALARINRVSAVSRLLWAQLRPLAPARVLDLGCGGGDVTRDLALRAARMGVDLQFHGLDMSPRAVEFARARAQQAGATVSYDTLHLGAQANNGRSQRAKSGADTDAATDAATGAAHAAAQADDGQLAAPQPLPPGYDVIMCTLMLHHLEPEDAVRLLQSMGRAASRLVLVADLNRSRAGLALAWAGTRLLTRSPVVHEDGVQSVRAAFTPVEALELARRAGLTSARVRRAWPCRWLLTSPLS